MFLPFYLQLANLVPLSRAHIIKRCITFSLSIPFSFIYNQHEEVLWSIFHPFTTSTRIKIIFTQMTVQKTLHLKLYKK